MNVWIIFDDCPREFSEKEIIEVCASQRLAEFNLNKYKNHHPYENQYLTIKKMKVKSEQ